MERYTRLLVFFIFIVGCGGIVKKGQSFAIQSENYTGVGHINLSKLPPKKQIVFQEAIRSFQRQVPKSEQTMTAYVWKDPKTIYSNLSTQKFRNHSSNVSSRQSFFDFKAKKGYASFFVDFAARKLGGGWRTSGWVQEEIMFSQIPQLGSYELGGLFTRTRSGSSSPQKGYPQPVAFKNVKRTIVFDSNRYGIYGGRELQKATDQQIKDSVKSLNPPQNVNILAIAAPRLTTQNPKSLGVLKDLFRTSYSGFQLVKEVSKGKSVFVGTGKFGAGAFKNDPIVSNVVQQLAAFHAGVDDVLFYGYSLKEQNRADQIVARIKKNIKKTTTIHELLKLARRFV